MCNDCFMTSPDPNAFKCTECGDPEGAYIFLHLKDQRLCKKCLDKYKNDTNTGTKQDSSGSTSL